MTRMIPTIRLPRSVTRIGWSPCILPLLNFFFLITNLSNAVVSSGCQDANGIPMPKNPNKTEMGFVTLRKELVKNKEETEKTGVKWQQLLATNGLEVKPYAIEEDKLLFVVQSGLMDMLTIRTFAIDQVRQRRKRDGDGFANIHFMLFVLSPPTTAGDGAV